MIAARARIYTNMARIQPLLTPEELAMVDQIAELTDCKRTEVIKNALVAYRWLLRRRLTGNRVVSHKPTGEEAARLPMLEGKHNRLCPARLGSLAKRLARASDPADAAQIKERLTRGFYGIQVERAGQGRMDLI